MRVPRFISQTGLVHYDQCRRRFWLKYIEPLDWPAPVTDQSKSIEESLKKGAWFHRLIEQDQLGLHVDPIIEESGDTDLKRWWNNYKQLPPPLGSPARVYSEISLAAPVPPVTLTARYDRLVLDEKGQYVIVDWKTGKSRPDPQTLRSSWQTVVYLFILAEAGHQLPGNRGSSVPPEQIRLVYWYAEDPHDCLWISYDQNTHEAVRARIEEVIKELSTHTEREAFAMTEHKSRCRLCTYQTYCGRTGDESGMEETWDESWLADLILQENDGMDLV